MPGAYAWGLCILCLFLPAVWADPEYTSISVNQDPSWDKIRIILDCDSAPKYKNITYLKNPARVQVDLEGSLDGIDPSKTDHSDFYLDSLKVSTINKDRVRVTAYLKEPTNGARVEYYDNNSQKFLYIDINLPSRYQQPAWTMKELRLAKAKGIPIVVIDPGHGGYDNGATSKALLRQNKTLREKDVVLYVSLQVARILRARGKVYPVLTRSGDYYPTLDERVEMVGATGSSLLVSIHADSAPGNRSASGFAAWVLDAERRDVASEAHRILKYGWRSLLSKLPISKQNLVIARQADHVEEETNRAARTILASIDRGLNKIAPSFENRGVKEKNLKVLRHYYAPSVLLEIGFLSNLSDSVWLTKKEFKNQMAVSIAHGIETYFSGERSNPPYKPIMDPGIKIASAKELPAPPNFIKPKREIALPEPKSEPRAESKANGAVVEHVVKRGDSLSKIASLYKVDEKSILEASGMPSRRKVLYPGDLLKIPIESSQSASAKEAPAPAATAAPQSDGFYTVAEADSLLTLSLRYGTTINELRELNSWSANRTLRVGEVIKVPSTAAAKTASSAKSNLVALDGLEKIWTQGNAETQSGEAPETEPSSEESAQIYRVQAGDTLASIAARHGLDPLSLRKLNGLKTDLIKVGQELKVPANARSAGTSDHAQADIEQLAQKTGNTEEQVAN